MEKQRFNANYMIGLSNRNMNIAVQNFIANTENALKGWKHGIREGDFELPLGVVNSAAKDGIIAHFENLGFKAQVKFPNEPKSFLWLVW